MNWDKTWADLAAEMLFCWRPNLTLSFYNAASGGSTCRHLVERLETNVIARKPTWVIASVAGNDLRVGITTAEYREWMSAYARRVREAEAKLLLFGISEHGPDYPKMESLPGRRAYYRILSEIAEDHDGVFYEDVGPHLKAKADALFAQHPLHTIYGDTGHFNAVGHLIMAGEILRIFGIVNDPSPPPRQRR